MNQVFLTLYLGKYFAVMRKIVLILFLFRISLIQYGQIIADHTVVDKFDNIPQNWINQVKKMWISYPGESHSESLRRGLEFLEAAFPAYQVEVAEFTSPASYTTAYLRADANTWGDVDHATGWIRWYGEEDWYNTPAAIAQTKAGITYCNTTGPALSAIGFGLCYGTGGGDYIMATQQYVDYCTANGYPTKVFFSTGPVDQATHLYLWTSFYNAIRSHVNANPSLILFDFSDILCYNNDGSGPNTAVDPDNGQTVPFITPESAAPNVGGFHFSNAGALRLAKAMWWMLARMAGWDGSPFIWEGGTSNSFANKANWAGGVVPPDNSDITISPSALRPCLLDKNRILNNITSSQNTNRLVINGKQLTLNGILNLTNGAQIDATLAGSSVIFSGSSAQVIPSNAFVSNRIANLASANSSGLSIIGNMIIDNSLSTTAAGKLTISSSNDITVGGSIVNNGNIILGSDVSGTFSLMMNGYSGPGNVNVNMYLTGGMGSDYNWHYVAVPANILSTNIFLQIDNKNLLRYDESLIPDEPDKTPYNGWVWHDGYVSGIPPNEVYGGPAFTTLDVGRGYNFYHSQPSASVQFTGLHSLLSNLSVLGLQYSGDGKQYTENYGLNLLGNSLTCSLDWNLVSGSDNTGEALYITKGNKLGVIIRGMTTGTNNITNIIPPLQGFFVWAYGLGTSLDFSNARVHSNQARYKSGSTSSETMIKLELNRSGNQDETIVWFNDKATNSFDRKYDAAKLFFSVTGTDQIYTWSGADKYVINGIPFPAQSITIPMGVRITNQGSVCQIIATKILGLENYKVTLTDRLNSDLTIDLNTTDRYSFTSDAGTFNDRFYITISKVINSLPETLTGEKPFNVYTFNKVLNIELISTDWDKKTGSVSVYDLAGRKVLYINNVEWMIGDLKNISLDKPDGLYIVEIRAGKRSYVAKIRL
jgi:hypothetical protein